jgi:cytochrome P450
MKITLAAEQENTMLQSRLLDLKSTLTSQELARVLCNAGDIFKSTLDNVWVVTSIELAKQILADHNFSANRLPYFAARMPEVDMSLIAQFAAVVSKMMVMSDAPQHTGRRRICYHAFTAQLISSLQPKIQYAVDHALSRATNPLELVADYAEQVTAAVFADLFLVPEHKRREFYYWSNTMTQFFGGISAVTNDSAKEVNYCATQLYQYYAELMQNCRADPSNDFMSLMLEFQNQYELTDDEVISQAILFLVAGQVTTADQFCNNVFQLLTNSQLLQELKTNQNYETAIDELTRIDPAVSFLDRIVVNPIECGGVQLQKGEVVLVATFAANHDKRYFEEPFQTQLNRKNNKHISFGFGTHYCLGSKLAKIIMVKMMQNLLTLMPDIQLDPHKHPLRKTKSLAFTGFDSLSVVNAK